MIQEDKQLLLKDLCARLPYGVKCAFYSSHGVIPSTIVKIDIDNETISHKPEGQSSVYFHFVESGNIKPYLRPMSSMTDEEKEEFRQMFCYEWEESVVELMYYSIEIGDADHLIDWLNEHHFDYRGLIEKGLALEATEGMYKNE